MVKVGLFVRIEPKPGKEQEIETFLKQGQSIVNYEPATVAWFAFKLPQTNGQTAYGIYDVFADDQGRQAHLTGEVAKQLMSPKIAELLAKPPEIHKLDILADKLPR